MIPPNHGSSLLHDSSLNMTPGEHCYVSGYEGPNEIPQDVPYRAWNLIYVVNVSDLEDETMTCGSLYKFSMLNSLEICHLG